MIPLRRAVQTRREMPGAGVAHPGAFAAAIAARRRGRIGTRAYHAMPLLSLALRGNDGSPAAGAWYTSVSLRPRLRVAVAYHAANQYAHVVQLPAASTRVQGALDRGLTRPAARAARRVEARLRTKTVRLDVISVDAPRPTASYNGVQPAAPTPVPVLPLVARLRRDDAERARSTPQPSATWSSPPPASIAPRAFAPAEIARITDDVLRSLDHRIAAQRERRGRR